MPEYIGGDDRVSKYMFWFLLVPAMVLLFVALTQPVWRGDEMLAEMRANCDKVGGVMLENKTMFGTSYECSPRYDQGIVR